MYQNAIFFTFYQNIFDPKYHFQINQTWMYSKPMIATAFQKKKITIKNVNKETHSLFIYLLPLPVQRYYFTLGREDINSISKEPLFPLSLCGWMWLSINKGGVVTETRKGTVFADPCEIRVFLLGLCVFFFRVKIGAVDGRKESI